MVLSEKIIHALHEPLEAQVIQIEDEDGISGYVVSPRFENMSSMDRQVLLDETLRSVSSLLTAEEQSRILMIAALTPAEYEHTPHGIRIHQIQELADGGLEFTLKGGPSDVEYVQEILANIDGVAFSAPVIPPGAPFLMKFIARRNDSAALTKEMAIDALANDDYIRLVLSNSSHS